MVKDIKYIIKRILIGVGICLVLSLIRGNLFIMANAKVLVDNNQLSYNNYLVLQQGSSQFHFYDDTVYPDLSVFPQYFVLNMCTDSQDVNSWSVANNSLINVNFYNTKISCTFPNSTYTGGHIMYIYGQVNPNTSCNSSLVACFQNGYINFTVPNRSSWSLLSYQLSKDSINIEYGSNTIINQNQMILSGQQSIINNQNQNSQDIINNQEQNTQDLIDNQNSNTEVIQDTINDNLQNCIDSHSVSSTFVGARIYSSGNQQNYVALSNSNSAGVIDVSKYVGQRITISFNSLDSSHTYRNNYCFVSNLVSSGSQLCLSSRYSSSSQSPTNTFADVLVPSGAKYLYLVGYINYVDETWVSSSSISFPRICSSKLDDMNNNMNDINNSLNDDSGVNDSDIDDLFGDIRGNSSSPVSDLLTLPITLLQAYLDGMSGSCSPYTLGTLYGTTLVLPCIDIPGIIGTSLWNVVDALFCLYMIYNIAMMCISIYESFTSLDDSMQLLYSPQHSGHTRVSRNEGEY